MRPILVTGASGFVGWNAVRYFVGLDQDVVATFHTFPHYLHQVDGPLSVRLDLTDGTTIEEIVARHRPSFILNAAARARPQESGDFDAVRAVNVEGAGRLACAAAAHDIPFVHLSTDLVYPADAGLCDESTPTLPSGAGHYAATKLMGEEAVRAEGGRWIIIRPSLMYGHGTPRSRSFTQFLDRHWERGERAPLFTDQIRSVLHVDDLITAVDCAVRAGRWNELYLCGGPEPMSRAEFGLRYADARGVSREMCNRMKAAELPGYIGGGSDIRLDTTKLESIGWRGRTTEAAFAAMSASP